MSILSIHDTASTNGRCSMFTCMPTECALRSVSSHSLYTDESPGQCLCCLIYSSLSLRLTEAPDLFPVSCFSRGVHSETPTQTFALYLLMRSDFISVTLFSKAPPVSYANDLISSTGVALIAACWVGTLLAMRTNELRTLWTVNIKKYIYASREHCKEISRGTFILLERL